jgi:hypothetical protein
MNMISQLRARIQEAGMTILTADEYNQLQREWITRTGAEDMVAAETERCAKLCESLQEANYTEWKLGGEGADLLHAASAIRGSEPNAEVDRASGSGRTQS